MVQSIQTGVALLHAVPTTFSRLFLPAYTSDIDTKHTMCAESCMMQSRPETKVAYHEGIRCHTEVISEN